MGIKGRRVHMIEELSETIISFQKGIFIVYFFIFHSLKKKQFHPFIIFQIINLISYMTRIKVTILFHIFSQSRSERAFGSNHWSI